MTETDQPHPYLSGREIASCVHELFRRAGISNVRIALIGGVAMQAYGSDRLTRDVDVLVSAEDAGKLLFPPGTPLSFGGESTAATCGVQVDLIWRDDDYRELYAQALERAALDPTQGPIPIVRIDDLAAMKLAAGRPKDELDLTQLVVRHPEARKRMRQTIRETLGRYAGDAFDRLADEAEWLASKGRL